MAMHKNKKAKIELANFYVSESFLFLACFVGFVPIFALVHQSVTERHTLWKAQNVPNSVTVSSKLHLFKKNERMKLNKKSTPGV